MLSQLPNTPSPHKATTVTRVLDMRKWTQREGGTRSKSRVSHLSMSGSRSLPADASGQTLRDPTWPLASRPQWLRELCLMLDIIWTDLPGASCQRSPHSVYGFHEHTQPDLCLIPSDPKKDMGPEFIVDKLWYTTVHYLQTTSPKHKITGSKEWRHLMASDIFSKGL